MRRPLALIAVLAVVAAVAACNGEEAEEPTRVDGAAVTAPLDDQPGRRLSAPLGSAQSGVRLSRIGAFERPTYVAAPPGDKSRVFVTEQSGRIRVLVNRKLRSRPFIDIRGDVNCCGERGLLSMAFARDYAKSGRFYVYLTGADGDIRVWQYRRSSKPDVASRSTRREIIRIEHSQFPNHNGGQVQIGPDGLLYLATGDGGGGGDPLRSAQSLGSLLGKLLRIAPRSGGGYKVPSDNPFRSRSGARGEIWAYGLRNPYRFSFDRRGGALTIGDVGQSQWDEIDRPANGGRGANFGWSVFEADSRFRDGSAPGHVEPILVKRLGDNGNCATIGGYVVRDPKLPSLAGRYLHGDNCNPRIYSARVSTSGASGNRATGLTLTGLSSFGEDALGRVYVTSLEGGVYRIVAR